MNDLSQVLNQEKDRNERAEMLAALRSLLVKMDALEKQVASLTKKPKGE